MVRVKICGITNAADALAAVEAGANLLGFNFYEEEREVSHEKRSGQKSARRSRKTSIGGHFVNASAADIGRTMQLTEAPRAQLHGDEPPEAVARTHSQCPVIKAFPRRARVFSQNVRRIQRRFCLLVGRRYPGQYGGTGRTTDWMLPGAPRRTTVLFGRRPEGRNVAAAVRIVRPYGMTSPAV